MKRHGSTPVSDETWLQDRLRSVTGDVRAPQGFTDRVMNAVYREAMSPSAPAARLPERPSVLRLYRRIAFSFMLTAAVLTASLLLPRAAYPTLIMPAASGAALGRGPSAAVRGALAGAAAAVQGALGERLIGGAEQ